MRPITILLGSLFALLAGGEAPAAAYYISMDVPTSLGQATYDPSQVALCGGTTCGLALDLPDGVMVDGLHRMDGGDWLFSVDSPVTIGQVSFDPRDVVRLSAGSYSRWFDGAGAGIPAGVNVDAIFLAGGDHGSLVLSVDVPTVLGNLTVEPADLVEHLGAGSFRFVFDASAAAVPVPSSSNVIAADSRGSAIVLGFDVPTTLGASTFMPGDLVTWDGQSYALAARDPAWPGGSAVNALAFLADPGEVLASVRLARQAGAAGSIVVTWGASCSAGVEDYGIYEGRLGTWYGHTAIDCADEGGDLRETILPGTGNRYYLVVPRNANDEGSYGRSSGGAERPRGASPCSPSRTLGPCP